MLMIGPALKTTTIGPSWVAQEIPGGSGGEDGVGSVCVSVFCAVLCSASASLLAFVLPSGRKLTPIQMCKLVIDSVGRGAWLF